MQSSSEKAGSWAEALYWTIKWYRTHPNQHSCTQKNKSQSQAACNWITLPTWFQYRNIRPVWSIVHPGRAPFRISRRHTLSMLLGTITTLPLIGDSSPFKLESIYIVDIMYLGSHSTAASATSDPIDTGVGDQAFSCRPVGTVHGVSVNKICAQDHYDAPSKEYP